MFRILIPFTFCLFALSNCTTSHINNSGSNRSMDSIKYLVDMDKDGIFEEIEKDKYPEPSQGQKQWNKDFRGALSYPPSARNQNISGAVILEIMVNSFGKIESVEVVNSLSPDCDAAAKKAFQKASINGYNPLYINELTYPFKIVYPIGFWRAL